MGDKSLNDEKNGEKYLQSKQFFEPRRVTILVLMGFIAWFRLEAKTSPLRYGIFKNSSS